MKNLIQILFISTIIFSCVENKQANNTNLKENIEQTIIPLDNTDSTLMKSNIPSTNRTSNSKIKYTTFEEAKKLSINELDIIPYTFRDTFLSGGYHLSYRVEKDTLTKGFLQSMTLVKGEKDINVIGMTSYPMQQKSLGYIGADFDKTFAFIQSFGSGNPHLFQLIEKQSGKELVDGVWIDAHEKEQIILYLEEEDTLDIPIMFDIKNQKKQSINEFSEANCTFNNYAGIRNCLSIEKVDNNKIILSIEIDSIRQIYNR